MIEQYQSLAAGSKIRVRPFRPLIGPVFRPIYLTTIRPLFDQHLLQPCGKSGDKVRAVAGGRV